MVRRVVASAAASVAFAIAAGAGVWFARVHVVADAAEQQARFARELLDARAHPDVAMARSLLVPGLHVVVVDVTNGRLCDAGSAGVAEHAFPPDGGPGLPPGQFGPPPGPGIAAPGAPGPGPNGLPGAGPQRGPQPNFAAGLAARVAGIRPIQLERDDAFVTIGPDAQALATWLAIDLLAVLAASSAIVLIATRRVAAHARADRRALEATSEERRAAAERYQRFLAETAHELRTPLTIVSGYVDILRAEGGHAFDARIIDGLHAETSRMRLLVAKMLALARLESPAGVARLLDVAEAAHATVATIRRRYPERDISLATEPSGAARIVIDADDFNDALANLIENAVKYAPKSAIDVATRVREGNVEVSVTDCGAGVAPADRDRIFERFYRGGERDGVEGLGLGLAIVKGVADRWSGSIGVDSRPGHTIFTLAFPLAEEERYAVAR